jgi:hypothetical protein
MITCSVAVLPALEKFAHSRICREIKAVSHPLSLDVSNPIPEDVDLLSNHSGESHVTAESPFSAYMNQQRRIFLQF